MNVLLLDGHTVQTISVARALKSAGHHISAFISTKISYGAVCRYIDNKVYAPKTDDANRYITFLNEYLSKHHVDVIIPMFDESALLLSKNKNEIEHQFPTRCAVPDYKTFSTAHNKQKLMDLCYRCGFPHPATFPLRPNNIDEAVSHVGFPAIIKPDISAGAKGIVKVNDIKEIVNKLPFVQQQFGSCTLQHFIVHTGIYYNVMLYRTASGEIVGHTVLKIMRYFPIKGGTSCYCETVEHMPLVSICKQVLEQLNWIGFADFDIMEEKDTHKLMIIEINPRVPASIHAAWISNINFPEIIVCDTLGTKLPQYVYHPGKKMRYMGLDVMWFIFSPDRWRFRPSWFKFWGTDIHYQDGSLDDPWPMLVGCISGLCKYLNPDFLKAKLKK